MKGLDIFIVRLLPFVLFIIFGINRACLWNGNDIRTFYNLHGNSALYAIALFSISLANNKYHCVWNRGMYLFLIVVPIFNFLNASFGILREQGTYLIAISILYGIVIIYTSFMATRHFIQLSIKRHKNGNDQY